MNLDDMQKTVNNLLNDEEKDIANKLPGQLYGRMGSVDFPFIGMNRKQRRIQEAMMRKAKK